MQNFFSFIFISIILIGCSTPSSRVDKLGLNRYQQDVAALISYLSVPTRDQEKIKEESLSLIDQAVPLLESFAQKYPECSDVIEVILERREDMLGLSLEEIERDFHEGLALPESSLRCYNPKELIVHPATVYLLTESDDEDKGVVSMQAELEELASHFELFAEDMNKD